MTTMFVVDDCLRSYVFIGDSKEIKKNMQEAYSTDSTYRRLINSMSRYATIREGSQNLRKLAERAFGLEDKL